MNIFGRSLPRSIDILTLVPNLEALYLSSDYTVQRRERSGNFCRIAFSKTLGYFCLSFGNVSLEKDSTHPATDEEKGHVNLCSTQNGIDHLYDDSIPSPLVHYVTFSDCLGYSISVSVI